MIRVGMTGGIACGKSQAAHRFAELGVPIIDADDVARALTAPDGRLARAVAERAGPETLAKDGSLDRTRLRARMFRDEALRRDLESLLHPPIRTAIRDWFARQEGKPYAIAVVPLLVEAGWRDDVDRILVVHCPERLQRARLRARAPKMDNTQTDAILSAQLSAAERLRHADDVIVNEAGLDALERAAEDLHRKYMAA